MLPLPCFLPGHTVGMRGKPSGGSCVGDTTGARLFVPAVALLAVPPSASSQLENSWEMSGHITGPNFTAACLASFLASAAERKDLILHPFICTNNCLRDSVRA